MARLIKGTLAFLAGAALCQAQPAPTPSPSPVAKSFAEGFELPVPEGMPVTGIKVPHYDDEGNLLMVLEASVAKRSQPSLATCATHALGLMATPSLVASATSTACSLGADGLADAKAAAKRAESSMHVAAEATGHSTASVYAGSSSWWM